MLQAALKKISADHKTETAAITDLQAVIKAVNPDLAEKVSIDVVPIHILEDPDPYHLRQLDPDALQRLF